MTAISKYPQPLLDPRNDAPFRTLRRAETLGFREGAIRALMGRILGRGELSPSEWATKGTISHDVLEACSPLPRLSLERHLTSPRDQFQKLLFRTHDSLAIETVIIPLHRADAASICLSSQVGCVMGCSFCATARMIKRRNLDTWEIVDQFIQARKVALAVGRKVTGAVFMGMGEPFLNYDKVMQAAELLCFPVQNAISARAITVSTVGLVQEIDRFTDEDRPFRLSISLTAATDEKRAQLLPVASRTPLKRLAQSIRRYAEKRGTRVNIAYVCIGGVNVGQNDAVALGELLADIPVRLDLIDVNDETGRYRPPTSLELDQFRNALNQTLRQPVARRYSGGADIYAACGTLEGKSTNVP